MVCILISVFSSVVFADINSSPSYGFPANEEDPCVREGSAFYSGNSQGRSVEYTTFEGGEVDLIQYNTLVQLDGNPSTVNICGDPNQDLGFVAHNENVFVFQLDNQFKFENLDKGNFYNGSPINCDPQGTLCNGKKIIQKFSLQYKGLTINNETSYSIEIVNGENIYNNYDRDRVNREPDSYRYPFSLQTYLNNEKLQKYHGQFIMDESSIEDGIITSELKRIKDDGSIESNSVIEMTWTIGSGELTIKDIATNEILNQD